MKLGDLIALAKMGYTPEDVRQLIAEPEDHADDEAEQKTEVDLQQDEAEPAAGSEDQKAEAEEVVDYKSMYEAEKEKTSKLQQLIIAADNSGSEAETDDLDLFSEAMKQFM